jgi:hypothetical protein
MMRRTTHLALLGGAGAILALTVGPDRPPANAAVAVTGELGCAVAADQPLVHAGDSLDTISLERNGVNFNALQHNMTLMRTGGSIIEVDAPVTDLLTMGCAADFNEDGYDDIIGTTALGTVKIYLNQTGTEAAPDWTIANILRTPLFANGVTVDSNTTAKGLGSMACGDVDNDGFADAVLMRCSSLLATNCNGPDRHMIYYGNGIGGVRETRTLLKSANTGRLYQKGNRVALHDVSGDGRPDSHHGPGRRRRRPRGRIIATTNLDKRFDNVVELFDDVGYASLGGVTSLAVADFTNDGKTDIAVGNAAESVVKLFTGSGGTTFANTGISIATNAFPVSLSAGNFALADARTWWW